MAAHLRDPDADSLFARDGRVCEWGRAAIYEAEMVKWDGRRLRVLPLGLLLEMAEQRGLDDRVALIKAAMAERGPASRPRTTGATSRSRP